MSTQGMVTIRKEGRVVMKIVAGCGGDLASVVANSLLAAWPVSAQQACRIAKAIGFGCKNCLFVVTSSKIVYRGEAEMEEAATIRCRKTFNQPGFNPRWDNGLTEFLEIIDLLR